MDHANRERDSRTTERGFLARMLTWHAPLDEGGLRVVIAAGVLVIAMTVGAWIAWPLFVVPGVLALGLVAYSAARWPTATLAVSALAVLADPVLVPTALPDEISFGPIGVSEPMLAVTGIVISAQALRNGRFWVAFRDPVVALAAAFVAIAALSAIVNAVPMRVAVLGIVMTVDMIGIYVLARMLHATEAAVWRTVLAVVLVAGVASLVGILQVLLHPDLLGFASFAGRFGEGGRITSFLGNPNMLAAVVGFALPFPLVAARHLPHRRDRRIAFGFLVLFALALLLTFSRGAWLAVLIGTAAGVLFIDRRTLVTLAAAVALAWLTTLVMPRNLLVAQADLARYFPESGAPSIIDSTLDRLDEVYERRDLRMRFIREGLPILADNPILGVGPGRYGGAASAIFPSPVYDEYDTSLYGFRTVHNFWLHLFGEVGVLGGMVFVAAIALLWYRFVMAARAVREVIEGRRFVIYAGTAVAIAVVVLNNMTEMIFEGNFPGFVVWLVIGLGSALLPPLRWPPKAAAPAAEA